MDGFKNSQAIRTHQEVADIMRKRGFKMTKKAVWHEERRAIQKLRAMLAPILLAEIYPGEKPIKTRRA